VQSIRMRNWHVLWSCALGGLIVIILVTAHHAFRYREAYHRALRYTAELKAQAQGLASEKEGLRAQIAVVKRMRDLLFVAAYQREEVTLSPSDDFEQLDQGNFSANDTQDREEVGCKSTIRYKNAAILLVLGQSNASNTVDARFSPPANVVNFNPYDGKCYRARDPLLGTTNYGGNFATRLGAKLVERGAFQAVVIANIAVGGTKVEQWSSNGNLYRRLLVTIKRLHDAQLEPTHVLWHQGEANVGDSGMAYREKFLEVFSILRRHGIYAPIFVAQATICGGEANAELRAGQLSLVDPAKKIFVGPDTDQLGLEYRYDGCHFDGNGADRHAELWYEAVDR
jgi:Carbohydrate esterase, sialic acid-specific acetylesterase